MANIETHIINLSNFMSEDEIRDFQEAIGAKFCNCGYMDDEKKQDSVPPKYVQNYLGESHGWICPYCGKFVQIG